MGLLKKMKDILFDEELDYTEQIKITPEMRNEDTPVKEPTHEIIKHEKPVSMGTVEKTNSVSERDTFQSEPTFPILDFDETEFNFQNSYYQKEEVKPKPEPVKRNTNVMDYERRKKLEKRPSYSSYPKMEITETIEKKKFRPSPIISPVYGILNKDYSKDDIINKPDDKISIEAVRDKAFGTKTPKLEKTKVYETTETVTITRPLEKEKKGKTIDELLEDTSDIIVDINNDLDNEIDSILPDEEITSNIETKKVNNPVSKQEAKDESEDFTDTLESDLFDIIDQMYDDKEEGE